MTEQKKDEIFPWFYKDYMIKCDPTPDDTGTVICDMLSSRSREETKQNAHLIVAAPALKRMNKKSIKIADRTVELMGKVFVDRRMGMLFSDSELEEINQLLLQMARLATAAEALSAKSEGETLAEEAENSILNFLLEKKEQKKCA